MPWKWCGVRIASIGSVGEVLEKELAIAIWTKDTKHLLRNTTITAHTEKGKTMSKYAELVDIVLDTLPEEHPWKGNVKGLVEKLVANGVTIRGTEDTPVADKLSATAWIPVTERLPEVVDTYLIVVKYKYDFEKEYSISTDVATYNPYEGGYIDNCWNTYIDWDEGQQYIHVTHWMPLPEPPKGE